MTDTDKNVKPVAAEKAEEVAVSATIDLHLGPEH